MDDVYCLEQAPESYGSMTNIRAFHNEGLGRLILNFDYEGSYSPDDVSPDDEDYPFDEQIVFDIEQSGDGVREPWVVDARSAVGAGPEQREYVANLGNVALKQE